MAMMRLAALLQSSNESLAYLGYLPCVQLDDSRSAAILPLPYRGVCGKVENRTAYHCFLKSLITSEC